jgi:hypothetical protein
VLPSTGEVKAFPHPKEPIMSTPTTDDQDRRIEQMEKALRRWKRGTLAGVLLLLLCGSGLFIRERTHSQRAEMLAVVERRRADEERARAEAASAEADAQARARALREAQGQAEQGKATNK